MSDGFWPLVMVFSFWGWVGGVTALILAAFPAGGGFRAVPATRWGVMSLALFSLWVIALMCA